MNRSSIAFAGMLLVAAAVGCSGSGSTRLPLTPSPLAQSGSTAQPAPVSIVVFTDPTSGHSTSDVRDADEQIVRFNTRGEVIWASSDAHFPGITSASGQRFERGAMDVRFGTRQGERRAYLTFSLDYYHYTPPATIVDLEIVGDALVAVDRKPPVALPPF